MKPSSCRCDYNLCRPCYEGNLVFEALEDAAREDVECGAGAAAALTLVPEDAEGDAASTAEVAGEEPAVCVAMRDKEDWASVKERGTHKVELD